MPKTAALSSIRRSSRSPVPPSSSSDSRSPDATAYQLLANQLEKEEWRQLSNRKGGFALVKKGHSIDDAVEGESMLIEDGFTLQKYEELFFDTLKEEVLEEWTNRLPYHPKLPAKNIKSRRKKKNRDRGGKGDSYVIWGNAPRVPPTKEQFIEKSYKIFGDMDLANSYAAKYYPDS
mmetsp:Transcript_19843/g.29686  ORF Transcript_19843/g.29686 Transcript_19843/m.29686 type:complete len:176 (-) Transcript_19843:178-705(-)